MGGGRDDIATVAAIAVAAVALTTVAHEAIGHGGACLLAGGQITQLTSVYFQCSLEGRAAIAGAGPLGNVAAGLLCWLMLRALPSGAPRLRWLLLLVMAFSFFWAAGYLLYSAATGDGDNAIVARILFGAPDWRWRAGLFVLGLILYRIGTRLTVSETRVFADGQGRARNLMLSSWIAGSIASVVATVLYAPDRGHAMIQGALEIGAASLPLLFLSGLIRPENAREAPIPRSPVWIVGCAIVFIAFAATLGRGLP